MAETQSEVKEATKMAKKSPVKSTKDSTSKPKRAGMGKKMDKMKNRAALAQIKSKSPKDTRKRKHK